MGMKIAMLLVLFSTHVYENLKNKCYELITICFIFLFPSLPPTPSPFRLSSPSLSLSEAFCFCDMYFGIWVWVQREWKMRRRNWMLWIRTSWQNTAAHVGGHFIENINSHKQHLGANSFQAAKTVLWIF